MTGLRAYPNLGNYVPKMQELEDFARETRAMMFPPTKGSIPLRWHRDASINVDRDWLVHELVAQTGKGLLSGQWGSAKTFVALDLSASVMTGDPFAGRRTLRQGGVLFIAPEGAFELPIRLRGLVITKITEPAEGSIRCGERIVDPADLPFAWIEECPRLVEAEALEILSRTARQTADELRVRYDMPLVLIIIDTVAAGAGFDDENSAAETQKVMNALEALSKATGAFVMGVDHFGKVTETGTRGSSAKEAAADTVLATLGTRDEAGNVANLRLAVRKVRGAKTGVETPYELEQVKIGEDRWGDPVTTCVVRWDTTGETATGAATPKNRWPPSARLVRQAMGVALVEHGRRMRPFGIEGPELLTVGEVHVRAEFVAAYPAAGESERQRGEAKRKAWKRALALATDKGLIACREVGGADYLWLLVDE